MAFCRLQIQHRTFACLPASSDAEWLLLQTRELQATVLPYLNGHLHLDLAALLLAGIQLCRQVGNALPSSRELL